jgi:SAM-dependent methyltransferase
MDNSQLTSYDLVAYPSYTHPQTHPDRLAAIGSLLGLKPAAVDHCRVLELGCGTGSNLVPMAWGLPQSQFFGIDLAARALAQGQQMIRDLGLKNLRLTHGNLMEVDDDWGKFDYIIAHGVYSWVPAEVREQVLAICRNSLGPQGIAFVSYNAFPGCHLRKMVREMMLFHVRGFKSVDERVQQAQELVRFLAAGQEAREESRRWMKAELHQVLGHDEGHLYHDELAEINEPVYFTQFIERASAHGLQYLAEADYFEMFDYGFKESVRQTLRGLDRNRILREQYLDFLKCRRFRQTLLCHHEIRLPAEPQAQAVAGFVVSSPAECRSGAPDLRRGVRCAYSTPKEAKCETDFALGKAALAVMGKLWPIPLPVEDVRRESLALLRQAGLPEEEGDPTRQALCEFLSKLYGAGVVDFRARMPPVARSVGERPATSPVARWQAQHGQFVTSLFHMVVKVEDEVGRSLLSWLDGTLDRNQLFEKLWSFLKSKDALILADGDEAAGRREIKLNLEQNLQKLARYGLLME